MKKIMTLFFVCAFFTLSISAFAVAETGWVAKVDENIDFRPSKDVEVYYDIDANASDNSQVYVIGTKHSGGDAVFGSSSGDSTIYKNQDESFKGKSGDGTKVTFPAAGKSDFGTGWEAI